MRDINYIVLHCTAGPQNQTIDAIMEYWHTVLGWKNPGYHFMIKPSGEVVNTFPIDKVSNGVAGHNANSIHISYIGGVKVIASVSHGKPINVIGAPVDNRTDAQKKSQIRLIDQFSTLFPHAVIQGHRDFSVDKNKDGIIEPSEWMKTCPSFEVKDWLKEIGFKSKGNKDMLVTTTDVNIREGADVHFAQVAPPLLKGTRVQKIGEADEWTYVQVNKDLLGWVASQYLEIA